MPSERLIDHLCDVQSDLFVLAAERGLDSRAFIDEWGKSETASEFDLPYNRTHWLGDCYLLDEIQDENGKIPQGENWGKREMRWIGWMYRLMAFRSGLSSRELVDIAPPDEMHLIYPGYHTLDPDMAVERVFEDKKTMPAGKAKTAPGMS